MSQSARLINKKKKSIYYHNTESVYNASDESRMLYGDSGNDDMYYNSTGNLGSDSKKQNIFSDIFSSSIDYTSQNVMETYLSEVVSALNTGGEDLVSLNKPKQSSTMFEHKEVPTHGSQFEEAPDGPGNGQAAWDPRLVRIDGFLSQAESDLIVPFASNTASSAYYDMLFNIERGAKDGGGGSGTGGGTSSGGNGGGGGTATSQFTSSDKTAPNTTQANELKSDANLHGTAALMNPYCVTRLVGGLTGSQGNFTSHLYDIRDSKRFYDSTGADGQNIVDDSSDVVSINNPTTTNIITWSNKDKYGRTPYSFQDFVFCKWWNIIPNNRLITFRKYAVPTYDNLNFPGMDKGNTTVAPIATVVTYFGGESANRLSDFLKFTTGTKWKDINADIHQVTGDTGSNPRAVVDSMFENGGGFGGQGSGSSIVNSFLGAAGGLTGQYLSFGKFLGLLDPKGYDGHSQKAWENLTSANMDPSESIYSNKIIGPVNRIQSVKAREAGIEFSQSFSLVCEYVARPIGGINTKAAMLDILANAMEIASPEASFWGGGYRFMIKPHMYPFKRDDMSGSIMDALYAGKIFGNDGAIARGFKGLVDFGTSNGSFEWSNVTEKLGSVLSQTVGAIGNMLQSVSSALFGESSSLTSWLKKGTDALSGEDAQKAGTAKLNSMFGNLNKMWKDKVIQETTMPNLQGMKAILTGEPTGNWHLTLGNPLNPIMVVGNLICTKMDVAFDDEMGPDDFPLSMKVTYTIEHAMARDKAGIQSMFNRGSGKIYKLPDYIKVTSDYETKVDKYTGRTDQAYMNPQFMNAGKMQSMTGARGYQTYKISEAKNLPTTGNANTTFIPKFIPVDREQAYQTVKYGEPGFLSNNNVRSVFLGNLFTRKRSNN